MVVSEQRSCHNSQFWRLIRSKTCFLTVHTYYAAIRLSSCKQSDVKTFRHSTAQEVRTFGVTCGNLHVRWKSFEGSLWCEKQSIGILRFAEGFHAKSQLSHMSTKC